ncbi:MAG: pyridine nucleotide-disulfide oxidoreductase [Thermoplasmata archaeon]|nr:MAG: pyridine nucleotide-disulfide oxidoreductase [Thermoplasmata archaeon]RLF76770.1 MAG: pyridine nucleotide-disulfide oxidoreductase [Thermoplasmata archaeon]
MADYDVIIVGGGPVGSTVAKNVKRFYPEKSVAIFRREKRGIVPCSIPYICSTLGSVDNNLTSDEGLKSLGVEIHVGEVERVLPEEHAILCEGKHYTYRKLVLATGSVPRELPLEGKDLEGIFYVKKDEEYLRGFQRAAQDAKKIAIIGGGFIGVELADDLLGAGKSVTIIEMLDRLLPLTFDEDFAREARKLLEEKGARILLKETASRFLGEGGRVRGVELKSGGVVEADVVVVAVGARPNSELAKEAGLKIGEMGGIWVDEYMRTSAEDILAAGDCAERRSFFTQKPINTFLASVGCREAVLVGSNMFEMKIEKANPGTVSIFSTSIAGRAFASAGLPEWAARKEGYELIVTRVETVDHHPGTMPGTDKIKMKMIFAKDSKRLIGAQLSGGRSVGEIINIVGSMIQCRFTADDIASTQVGTHPMLTPPPTTYPTIEGALSALVGK